ncbi:MAG: phage head closure protein [Planctomycetota bacterium]
MRLGELRHLLVHEVAVESRELDGGVATEWDPRGVAWGKVEPLLGRKLELAQRQEPRVTHRVTLRYHPTLQARDRLVFDEGRALHVHSVLTTDEGNDETIVLAEEVAA